MNNSGISCFYRTYFFDGNIPLRESGFKGVEKVFNGALLDVSDYQQGDEHAGHLPYRHIHECVMPRVLKPLEELVHS
jgi:hypothetical protein